MARVRAVREFHGVDSPNSPRRLAALRRELVEMADALDRAAGLLAAVGAMAPIDKGHGDCLLDECVNCVAQARPDHLRRSARICRNLARLLAAIEDPAAYLKETEDDE
jgi:hypothetical protein